jgi:ribosome-associated protein
MTIPVLRQGPAGQLQAMIPSRMCPSLSWAQPAAFSPAMALRPRPTFHLPHWGPDEEDDTPRRPSKTQLKKDSHDAQALGQELAALSEERLDEIVRDEALREALREWKRTRSFEGKRRQLQYIGKLMRGVDTTPYREALDELKLGSARATLELHESERWRAELLASDDALTQWMSEHPETDAQQLRSLVRAARKDAAAAPEQRSGRAFRELFQLIKAARSSTGSSPDADTPEEPND